MLHNHTTNPWKDIMSYDSSEHEFFKGRDEDLKKFLSILNGGSFSVIYSASGIGKTSFLNAGIEPCMKELGFVPVHILFHWKEGVETEIIKAIDESLNSAGITWQPSFTEWKALKSKKRDEYQTACEQSLWWRLRTYKLINTDGKSTRNYQPLLIFDQFEEVFRNEEARISGQKEKLFQLLHTIYSYTLPETIQEVMDLLYEQRFFLDIPPKHLFKAVFALRKEYLSDFDYWTNDRHRISDLLHNRMLLQPMTRQQAEEVITQQPRLDDAGNIIEGETTKTLLPIKQTILDFIDDHKRDEVEPFLLSVLCSRLFELAAKNGVEELSADVLKDWNIRTIIRDFYEELVKRCMCERIFENEDDVIRFENILVSEKDGHRIRASVRDNHELHKLIGKKGNINKEEQDETLLFGFLKKLEDVHLIRITSFGDERFVELVHDRVAEAIFERQSQRKKEQEEKKHSRRWKLGYTCLLIILMGLALHGSRTSDSRNRIFSDLTECTDLSLSTEDTAYFKSSGDLRENGLVEHLIIKDTTSFTVEYCSYLKSIKVESKHSDISLRLKRCPQLKSVSFSPNIRTVNLYNVIECPQAEFIIGPNVDTIIVAPQQDDTHLLSFRIEDNQRFLWEKAFDNSSSEGVKKYVLWDLKFRTILYAQPDVPESFIFPLQIIGNKAAGWANTLWYHNIAKHNEIIKNDSLIIDTVWTNPVHDYNRQDVNVVVLADTIKEIADNAFRECLNLKRIILSDSLQSIGDRAFYGCLQLDSLVLPSYVNNIGEEAFAHCSSLHKVTLNTKEALRLQYRAFACCTNLQEVELPDQLLWSHPYYYCVSPFFRCHNLKNFTGLQRESSTLMKDGDVIMKKDTHMPVFVLPSFTSYNQTFKEGEYYTENTILIWRAKGNSAYILHVHPESKMFLKKMSKHIIYKNGILFDGLGCLIVNDDETTEEITLPSVMPRDNWDFLNIPSRLQAIHIPYAQPENTSSDLSLNFNIPDSIKQRITLYVPFGCGKYYVDHPNFHSYKQIKEEPLYRTYLNIFSAYYQLMMSGNRTFWIIVLYIFALLLVSTFSWMSKKATIKQALWWTTCSFIAFFFFSLWICNNYGLSFRINQHYHFMTDLLILAVGSTLCPILVFLLKDVSFLSQPKNLLSTLHDKVNSIAREFIIVPIQQRIELFRTDRKIRIRFGLFFLTFTIGVILACWGINRWIEFNDLEVMMKKGNYSRAVTLICNELSEVDTLSLEQKNQLKEMLERTISLPDFSDNIIIEGVDSVKVSGERYIHVYQRGNTIVYDPTIPCQYEYSTINYVESKGKYAIAKQDSDIVVLDGDDLNREMCRISASHVQLSDVDIIGEGRYLFANNKVYDIINNGQCVYNLLEMSLIKGEGYACGDYICDYEKRETNVYDVTRGMKLTSTLPGKLVQTYPQYSLFVSEDTVAQKTYLIRPINGQEQIDSLHGNDIYLNLNSKVRDRKLFDDINHTTNQINLKVLALSDDRVVIASDSLGCYWTENPSYILQFDTASWHRPYYPELELFFDNDGDGISIASYTKTNYDVVRDGLSCGGNTVGNYTYDDIAYKNHGLFFSKKRTGQANYSIEYIPTTSNWLKDRQSVKTRHHCPTASSFVIRGWLYAYSSESKTLEIFLMQSLDDMIRTSPYLSEDQKDLLNSKAKGTTSDLSIRSRKR